VTIITTAFEVAAKARARVLGMQQHPIIVVKHPMASKTEAEVKVMAAEIVQRIVDGLTQGATR
jgi:hypothetical protein